jgi:predicted RNase H-like nuclease
MAKGFIGIDGCRAGWLVFILLANDECEYSICSDISSALSDINNSDLTLIDIPIGLIDQVPNERTCDLEARQLLKGGRASSVFPVPCRAAVYVDTYDRANIVNRQQTGRGLSKQSWFIAQKIREVDQLLQAHDQLRFRVRESHPELCFRALNGGVNMLHCKKSHEGRQERLAVLKKHLSRSEELFTRVSEKYLRKQVALDDILDAMVLAVASRVSEGRPLCLPENPPHDKHRFPMEIVYPSIKSPVVNKK